MRAGPPVCHDRGMDPATEDLLVRLRRLDGVVVAFSGGVDSTVVLAAALRALGPQRVLAAIADSPSLARSELARARDTAAALDARLLVVGTDEVSDPGYRANAGNRCYFCKRTVLSAIRAAAAERGMPGVATGTHLDDRRAGDRPGLRAAAELGVHEPLADAGFSKQMVRDLARWWRLPVVDKPSMPCLASRLAVGVTVSTGRLGVVERAEHAARGVLSGAGVPLVDLRVRLLGERFRVELDVRAHAAVAGSSLAGELLRAARDAGARGAGELGVYRSGAVSA